MRKRHRRIAAAAANLLAGRRPAAGRGAHVRAAVRAAARAAEPAQIVEAELRHRPTGKLGRRLVVEITQHAIAKPLARHRAKLPLDGLDRTAERRPARQRLAQIERT